MLKAVIELIGPAGSGKSILSSLLAKTLQPSGTDQPPQALNVLVIDACVDQGLTQQLLPPDNAKNGAVKSNSKTLTQLVQQIVEQESRYRLKGNTPLQRQEAQQALDWAFSNLTTAIALDDETDIDLLTVGLLTEHLPAGILECLRYAFPRLLDTYDYVVIDGYHPLIHPLVPEPVLSPLVVSHPVYSENLLPPGFQSLKTPALVVTQFQGEAFSPAIQNALAAQDVKLIGKMPALSVSDVLDPSLVSRFYDCLCFMDIPLNQSMLKP